MFILLLSILNLIDLLGELVALIHLRMDGRKVTQPHSLHRQLNRLLASRMYQVVILGLVQFIFLFFLLLLDSVPGNSDLVALVLNILHLPVLAWELLHVHGCQL